MRNSGALDCTPEQLGVNLLLITSLDSGPNIEGSGNEDLSSPLDLGLSLLCQLRELASEREPARAPRGRGGTARAISDRRAAAAELRPRKQQLQLLRVLRLLPRDRQFVRVNY